MMVKNNLIKMNKKGLKTIGISQVLILIIGIIAVSWAMGSSIGGVEASATIPTNQYITNAKTSAPYDHLIDQGYKITQPNENGQIFFVKGKEYYQIMSSEGKDYLVPRPNVNQNNIDSAKPLLGGEIDSAIFANQEMGSLNDGVSLATPPDFEWPGKFLGVGYRASQIFGHLAQGLLWAGIAYGAISLIGSFLPEEYQKYTDALAPAAAGGIMAAKLAQGLGVRGGFIGGGWETLGLGSAGIGLLVGAAIFYFMYKDEKKEVVKFACLPWEPPVGGQNCELCNKQGDLPCSEYQCRSLGQACQILNKGTNQERCEWVNPRDVEFPIIQPNENALLPNFRYTPDNTISPPDRGVIIEYTQSTNRCVPAFTPLSFGITLNEPGRCKVDYFRTADFESMRFFFGGESLFSYNHTQVMSLPGPESARAEGLILENGGNFELFVRCMDANGNYNKANFVFKFCVEDGPDVSPPLMSLSLLDNTPVAHNQTSIPIEVYTNEPASCRWSRQDKDYDDMEERMNCAQTASEMNARMVYTCRSTLTGLRNQQDNEFYFRCEDQPLKPANDRNQNTQSQKLVLKGTRPLVIDSVKPNETISDATDVVKVTLEVKSSAGYNQGQASCYYSPTNNENDYILFYDTSNTNGISKQDLYLPGGSYRYFIKCIDLGGNTDYATTSFNVYVDNDSPRILRAYHEGTYLKIITDEKAQCVYDVRSCNYNFDEATSLTAFNDVEHFTEWNTNKEYYIKCKDEYGNEPLPNVCSMVVKPFKIFQKSL